MEVIPSLCRSEGRHRACLAYSTASDAREPNRFRPRPARSDPSNARCLHRLEHERAVAVVHRADRLGDVARRIPAQDSKPCLSVPRQQIEGGNVVSKLVLLRAKRKSIRALPVCERDEGEIRRERPERASGF